MATSSLRPASVLLAFLGDHVVDQGVSVSSASLITSLAPLGIAETATRATLARMVRRGLLTRRQVGRQAYFTTTPRADAVVRDGRERVHHTDVVSEGWDGTWTMVTFSMPDSFQRERHALRAQLIWAGFGPLQSGVWISPRPIDHPALPGPVADEVRLRVFTATPAAGTDPALLAAEAYDLQQLAAGYAAFIRRWSGRGPTRLRDPLARRLLLSTEWLDLIRTDPRLPGQLLPSTWPARNAQNLFRTLWTALTPEAELEAASILELIPTR